MSVDFERELDYESLLQALIEKTKAGKIEWQPTADERAFLATVKGQRTFTISSNLLKGSLLTVKDAEGKIICEIQSGRPSTGWDLFEMARRMATNLDERLDETVQLIGDL